MVEALDLTLCHQRFSSFLFAKSRAVPFSYPSIPSRANPDCFDVFDDAFNAQTSEGASHDAVSYESNAFSAFLHSDGQTGELASMKNDWLRRMRFDIVSVEHKRKIDREAVRAHETAGRDPKDMSYLKTKFTLGETEKMRSSMAIDTEEGHVSECAEV
jgi:hypothetical protein